MRTWDIKTLHKDGVVEWVRPNKTKVVIDVPNQKMKAYCKGKRGFQESIRMMKVHTKAIKDILLDVNARNPYPEDIFIEPTKEDWALLNSICRINGQMSESFMGSFGRLVWKNCVKEMQDSIDNSVQDNEVKPN